MTKEDILMYDDELHAKASDYASNRRDGYLAQMQLSKVKKKTQDELNWIWVAHYEGYKEGYWILSTEIERLREALTQPEQEPVAKVVSTAPDRIWLDLGFDPQDETEVLFDELHDVTWSADNASGYGIEYVRATPPAAQQERPKPVAWGVFEGNLHDMFFSQSEAQEMAALKGTHAEVRPLYAAAAQRPWQGLTDEDKKKIATAAGCTEDDDGHIVMEIFRLAEIKLKGKNYDTARTQVG